MTYATPSIADAHEGAGTADTTRRKLAGWPLAAGSNLRQATPSLELLWRWPELRVQRLPLQDLEHAGASKLGPVRRRDPARCGPPPSCVVLSPGLPPQLHGSSGMGATCGRDPARRSA
jgi:hypothetical protein